jgi:hypothetical protein
MAKDDALGLTFGIRTQEVVDKITKDSSQEVFPSPIRNISRSTIYRGKKYQVVEKKKFPANIKKPN